MEPTTAGEAAKPAPSKAPQRGPTPIAQLPSKGFISVIDADDLEALFGYKSNRISALRKDKKHIRRRLVLAEANEKEKDAKGTSQNMPMRTRAGMRRVETFFQVSIDDLLKFDGTKSGLAAAPACCITPLKGTSMTNALVPSLEAIVIRNDFVTEQGVHLMSSPVMLGCSLGAQRLEKAARDPQAKGEILIHKRRIDDNPDELQGFCMEMGPAVTKEERDKLERGTRLVPPVDQDKFADACNIGFLTPEEISRDCHAVPIGTHQYTIFPEEHGLVGYFKTHATEHASGIKHFASACTPKEVSSQTYLAGNYVLFPETIARSLFEAALRDSREACSEQTPDQISFYIRCIPPNPTERKRLEALPDEERCKKRRITIELCFAVLTLADNPTWSSPEHLIGMFFPGLPILDMLAAAKPMDEKKQTGDCDANNALDNSRLVIPTVIPKDLGAHFCEALKLKRMDAKKKDDYEALITNLILQDTNPGETKP